jgi:hypothetical protein
LARVRIGIDGSNQQVETNDAGEFVVDGLAEGEDVIRIESVGYRLEQQRVTLTGEPTADRYRPPRHP